MGTLCAPNVKLFKRRGGALIVSVGLCIAPHASTTNTSIFHSIGSKIGQDHFSKRPGCAKLGLSSI